jgi:hypothetical protein
MNLTSSNTNNPERLYKFSTLRLGVYLGNILGLVSGILIGYVIWGMRL